MFEDTSVYFCYDRAEYTLNLPFALTDNKIGNARKLMQYMCRSNDEEHEAAKKTSRVLFELVEESAGEYQKAIDKYNEDYIDPNNTNLAPDYVDKYNRKFKRELDRAKRQYDKTITIRQEFINICKKYNTFDEG
jgi:hypothetical protein